MQDRVIFVGLLDDVRPFLAALDLGFVLSSRVETISFACREMMAMGLPVVVTDVAGLPENVEDGVDGWIVPACAPAAVSEVLREALREPGARGHERGRARQGACRVRIAAFCRADTGGVPGGA